MAQEINIKATFRDEVTSRMQNALDTVVEFGGSIDDLAKANQALHRAQRTGARGMAQYANVLRTLADESEQVGTAIESVGAAFELAERTGIKAEDAGRQYGQMLRGETAILQNFDKVAKSAASAIDGISDPTLRAEAASKAYRQALVRQNSVMNKARDRMKAFAATHPNVVQGLKLVGAATAATAAAIGAGLVKAIGTYMEQSSAMQASSKRLAGALDDLMYKVGSVIAESIRLKDAQDLLTRALEEVTAWVDKNKVAIGQWVTFVAQAATRAAQVVGNIALGIAMLVSAVVEGATEMVRKALGPIGELVAQIAGPLESMNALTLDQANALSRFGNELNNISKGDISLPITEALVDYQAQLNKAGDATVKFLSNAKVTGKSGGTRKRPGSSGGKPKYSEADLKAMQADEALRSAILGSTGGATPGAAIAGVTQGVAGSAGVGHLAASAQGVRDALTNAFGGNLGDGPSGSSLVGAGIADGINNITKEVSHLDAALTSLASGGIGIVTDSMSGLIEKMASGQGSMKALGAGIVTATGDLLVSQGKALILASSAVQAINTGLANPAASIALGAAMIAFGGTLKGFAARMQHGGGGGAGGGGTAAALDRFGRRLFEREDRQGREVVIQIEDRAMRGYIGDVVADGARRGGIPLTPRR